MRDARHELSDGSHLLHLDKFVGSLRHFPLQVLGVFLQFTFHSLTLCNIEHGSVQPQQVVIPVEYALTSLIDPADAPIRMDHSVLDHIGVPVFNTVHHRILHVFPVIGMNYAGIASNAILYEIGSGISAESPDLVADELHGPVLVEGASVGDSGNVRDQGLEALLALLQIFLRLLSISDVDTVFDHLHYVFLSIEDRITVNLHKAHFSVPVNMDMFVRNRFFGSFHFVQRAGVFIPGAGLVPVM